MKSAILPCSCKHAQQDKIHGRGRRVHNAAKGKLTGGLPMWLCTACQAQKGMTAYELHGVRE